MKGFVGYGAMAWLAAAALFGIVIAEKNNANVPTKQQLFYAMATPVAGNESGPASVHFEQTKGDNAGNVLQINGNKAYNEFVIQRSKSLPVVVKICSEHYKDSKKVASEFQAVAKTFEGRVTCVALDLFSFYENYHIVSNLMMQENILKLELPLFMFFKDGMLYRTVDQPAAILQGFYTHENLAQCINQKFFN